MSAALKIGLVLVVGALAQAVRAQGVVPTLPGDLDLNWSVDVADFYQLEIDLDGPRQAAIPADGVCEDVDGDGDVDLSDFAVFQTAYTGTQILSVAIAADADDGTETNASLWEPNGYANTALNRLGASGGESYAVGLRFQLPQVTQGEQFAYARLVLPATGYGRVDQQVKLRIVGVAEDDPVGFDLLPPSQRSTTLASMPWTLSADWPELAGIFDCNPLYRYSPDIAPLINEIIARPGWGSGATRTLALVIENDGTDGENYLAFQDYREVLAECPGVVAPRLELTRSVRGAIIGETLLGRPTGNSVTLNAYARLPLDAFVECGAASGVYDHATPVYAFAAETPIEILVGGLVPDRRYYYRLRYRRAGGTAFDATSERTFHTARARGETFTFDVVADSHLFDVRRDARAVALYRRTLRNVHNDLPDLYLDLGDTFSCEFASARSDAYDPNRMGGDVLDLTEALDRHLTQRPCLDIVCHSAAFFFALGNHEGEQGWRLDGTATNVAVLATTARKLVYPLPVPNGFYTGNVDNVPFCGLREDYYAWEWGDALFIVLDPFWYTTQKPHSHGGTPGTGNNWDWTLGAAQYQWLVRTLDASSATFKFVFAHHVTGGVTTYGRGGVEAASHALGGRGSFEWGGEDLSGVYVFDTMRPHWGLPIHDLLAAYGVTIFFHGHDHVFVKQDLDDVVYQACPQPSDAGYTAGLLNEGCYYTGDAVNNSGHLRVTVSPAQVMVEYVRSYLPGDGSNGAIGYSYTIPAP